MKSPLIDTTGVYDALSPMELALSVWPSFIDVYDEEDVGESAVQVVAVVVGMLAKQAFDVQIGLDTQIDKFVEKATRILRASIEGPFLDTVMAVLGKDGVRLLAGATYMVDDFSELIEELDENPDVDCDEVLLALGIRLGQLSETPEDKRDYLARTYLAKSLVNYESMEATSR